MISCNNSCFLSLFEQQNTHNISKWVQFIKLVQFAYPISYFSYFRAVTFKKAGRTDKTMNSFLPTVMNSNKKHQKQLIRCCFAILLGVKHKNSLHKEFKYSTYLQNLAYQNNGKHLEKNEIHSCFSLLSPMTLNA